MTNADKIRAMNDEDLATWLIRFCISIGEPSGTARSAMLRGELADWLKREGKWQL